MKALRKSLFVWVPVMGIMASAAEATTASKSTKSTCTVPTKSMDVYAWLANGSAGGATQSVALDYKNDYDCFITSFKNNYKPTPTSFTLMYSSPQPGGYGKNAYDIISSKNWGAVQEALKIKNAHVDYIPQSNWPMPTCSSSVSAAPSNTSPSSSIVLTHWNSDGTDYPGKNCSGSMTTAACKADTNCFTTLQSLAISCAGHDNLYISYRPTNGYGMECYPSITSNTDLMEALDKGYTEFKITKS